MFIVVPSKLDFGVVDGVLGNFNGDAADDFTVDGVNYKSDNLTSYFNAYK